MSKQNCLKSFSLQTSLFSLLRMPFLHHFQIHSLQANSYSYHSNILQIANSFTIWQQVFSRRPIYREFLKRKRKTHSCVLECSLYCMCYISSRLMYSQGKTKFQTVILKLFSPCFVFELIVIMSTNAQYIWRMVYISFI